MVGGGGGDRGVGVVLPLVVLVLVVLVAAVLVVVASVKSRRALEREDRQRISASTRQPSNSHQTVIKQSSTRTSSTVTRQQPTLNLLQPRLDNRQAVNNQASTIQHQHPITNGSQASRGNVERYIHPINQSSLCTTSTQPLP